MITKQYHANIGILILSAEADFVLHMNLLKSQATLAFNQSIKQIVVAVNDLDKVDYLIEVFTEIKERMKDILIGIGFALGDIKVIPVSSLQNENITMVSEKIDWYKGDCLKETLN